MTETSMELKIEEKKRT